MLVSSTVEGQSIVGKLCELHRRERRNKPTPATHRGLPDVKSAGNRGLISKMRNGVGFKHGAGKYLKGNPDATECGGPISNRIPGDNQRMRRGSKNKPDPIEVGKRIKFLRGARGLSMEQLAEKLVDLGAEGTISKSTVSKWENGKTDPTATEALTTYYLCKVLGTTHEFLLFGPKMADENEESAAKPHR